MSKLFQVHGEITHNKLALEGIFVLDLLFLYHSFLNLSATQFSPLYLSKLIIYLASFGTNLFLTQLA